MPTNMTIFKYPKYSCVHICSVDDAKIIDLICTWSKLIFKSKSNKHHTNMGNREHTVHGKSKQTESF